MHHAILSNLSLTTSSVSSSRNTKSHSGEERSSGIIHLSLLNILKCQYSMLLIVFWLCSVFSMLGNSALALSTTVVKPRMRLLASHCKYTEMSLLILRLNSFADLMYRYLQGSSSFCKTSIICSLIFILCCFRLLVCNVWGHGIGFVNWLLLCAKMCVIGDLPYFSSPGNVNTHPLSVEHSASMMRPGRMAWFTVHSLG